MSKTTSGEDRMYSAAEVAALLKVHPDSVRRWLRDGRINEDRVTYTRRGTMFPRSIVDTLLGGAA